MVRLRAWSPGGIEHIRMVANELEALTILGVMHDIGMDTSEWQIETVLGAIVSSDMTPSENSKVILGL